MERWSGERFGDIGSFVGWFESEEIFAVSLISNNVESQLIYTYLIRV